MRMISEYVQFPGRCMFTQSSDTSHGVLDTGLDIDVDGHVYMSGKLVEEAAGMIGWTSPVKTAELETRIAELEVQNAALSSVLDAADNLAETAKLVTENLDAARATVAA